MRITGFNELDLTGEDQESIRVAVNQSAGGAQVTWSLNGQTFAGGAFALDKTEFPVFKFLATILYKTDSGGSVEFQVTGSAGGDVSIHDVVQAPGEAFDVAMYRIVIV